jgi:hypothetical protein
MRALLILCLALLLSSCGGGDPEDLPEARQSGANHGAR